MPKLGSVKLRTGLIIGATAILVMSALTTVFFVDPTITVHLKNDYPTRVSVSCQKSTDAQPGHELSIPISVFNPFPCWVYEGKSTDENPKYLGCLRFNPLVDHQALLSEVVSHLSEDHCWDTAPR